MLRLSLFRGPIKKKTDPWAGGEISWIIRCRSEIEGVAEMLSTPESCLFTRFSREHVCAEIYFRCGIILAQITARGQLGSVYELTVTGFGLTERMKDVFRANFPSRVALVFKSP